MPGSTPQRVSCTYHYWHQAQLTTTRILHSSLSQSRMRRCLSIGPTYTSEEYAYCLPTSQNAIRPVAKTASVATVLAATACNHAHIQSDNKRPLFPHHSLVSFVSGKRWISGIALQRVSEMYSKSGPIRTLLHSRSEVLFQIAHLYLLMHPIWVTNSPFQAWWRSEWLSNAAFCQDG